MEQQVNQVLLNAVNACLHDYGIYDEEMTEACIEFYNNNKTITTSLVQQHFTESLLKKYTIMGIIYALNHGPTPLYDISTSDKIEYTEKQDKPGTDSDAMPIRMPYNELYEHTKNSLVAAGALFYTLWNPYLGPSKRQVYKQLVDEGIGVMTSDAIMLKDVYDNSVVLRTCPVCHKDKAEHDFPTGRSMCKECYNSSRRSTSKSEQAHSTTYNEVEELIDDFNRKQRKLYRDFKDEMQYLINDFKDELKSIIEEGRN